METGISSLNIFINLIFGIKDILVRKVEIEREKNSLLEGISQEWKVKFEKILDENEKLQEQLREQERQASQFEKSIAAESFNQQRKQAKLWKVPQLSHLDLKSDTEHSLTYGIGT